MAADLHEVAAERLRRLDQRYTRNRRTLVEALAPGRPLTLPELLEATTDLPQSSAYRNLAVLEEAGVVRRIVGGDFARYELAEDLTEHHHHLICTECGAVDDFTLPPAVERTVESALARTARRNRFAPAHHRLDLVGVCERCRAG